MSASGVQHWKVQRITAIALIPLSVWFLISLLALPAHDYTTVVTWIAQKWSAGLLMIFIALGAWHSHLGVTVVLEDYLKGSTRTFWIVVSRIAHIFATFAMIFAVFYIAFGSRA
jgi:succinate dehydrogenase / fumarate reductase, membrane anchor subunit